jgi:hypothetical protein
MELRSVRLTRTHREAERANALTGRAKISYVRIIDEDEWTYAVCGLDAASRGGAK